MTNLVGCHGSRQPRQGQEPRRSWVQRQHQQRREQLEMRALQQGADATLAQIAADAWLQEALR